MTSSKQNEISIFQRLHPRAYLEKFLAEGIRPDGRESSTFRNLDINVGSITTADGSALVRLGETTIVCGVKAEIAEPELDAPTDGFLVPNVEISAICSPKFKPGPPSEEAQVCSEQLNQLLKKANVLPLDSLCIHPGKAVWSLYVDAICINYDGSAFDATLLAMLAALKNTRLPSAVFEEDTGRTICSKKLIPLLLKCTPHAMTFGVFDSKHVLADPTAFEEPLLDTTVTVVLDEDSENLISIAQYGPSLTSAPIGSNSSLVCIRLAKERVKTVAAQMKDPFA